MIKAVINVEAPRSQVFSALTDFARYTQWLPGCEKAVVVSSTPSSVDTEITINSMKRMTLGLRFEPHPTQALNFRMYSGKDIKAYSGAYRLMDSADGGGTVVIAELELDAGPMAPKFLVDRMAKKALDDTGKALCKYIATMPAQAAPAPPAPAKGAKKQRPRIILRVVKTDSGHRICLLGQTLVAKNHS